jgi:hypothetical protein
LSFGTLVHTIRDTEEGCELRTRCWLGRIEIQGLSAKGILNRFASSRFIAKHAMPLDVGWDLFGHNAMEYNDPASFRPDLYADYHPDEKKTDFRSTSE